MDRLMKKTITIEMRGGLPESVILPVELKDYKVRIIEFEFGDLDEDEDNIKTDEHGREYYEYQAASTTSTRPRVLRVPGREYYEYQADYKVVAEDPEDESAEA
jgi:hypothetical protein